MSCYVQVNISATRQLLNGLLNSYLIINFVKGYFQTDKFSFQVFGRLAKFSSYFILFTYSLIDLFILGTVAKILRRILFPFSIMMYICLTFTPKTLNFSRGQNKNIIEQQIHFACKNSLGLTAGKIHAKQNKNGTRQ